MENKEIGKQRKRFFGRKNSGWTAQDDGIFSAFFAGITSVLAKCGIKKTDSVVYKESNREIRKNDRLELTGIVAQIIYQKEEILKCLAYNKET